MDIEDGNDEMDSSDGNVDRSLMGVSRRVERIGMEVEKVLDDIADIVRKLREKKTKGSGGITREKQPPSKDRAPVIHDFHPDDGKEGRAMVSFGGGRFLSLRRVRADLLAILASDEDPSTDDLVAFKSFDAIGERLARQLDRDVSHHYISQLLYQLRLWLKAKHLDPRLVERSRKLGARLRVKRQSAGLSAG